MLFYAAISIYTDKGSFREIPSSIEVTVRKCHWIAFSSGTCFDRDPVQESFDEVDADRAW